MTIDQDFLDRYQNLCPRAVKFLRENPQFSTLQEALEVLKNKKGEKNEQEYGKKDKKSRS